MYISELFSLKMSSKRVVLFEYAQQVNYKVLGLDLSLLLSLINQYNWSQKFENFKNKFILLPIYVYHLDFLY